MRVRNSLTHMVPFFSMFQPVNSRKRCLICHHLDDVAGASHEGVVMTKWNLAPNLGARTFNLAPPRGAQKIKLFPPARAEHQASK
jgi:hypothetical protein